MQNYLETQPAALSQAYLIGDLDRPSSKVRAPARTTYDRGYALPSNADFVDLLDAYQNLGGLARAQEVAVMVVNRCGPSVIGLATWILERQLLSFEWQSQIWIPLFQFERDSMVPHRGLLDVLAALSHTFAPWEQALWFALPNDWLSERRPANVIALDPEAVADAARADGYVAAG